jgi:hypothetical protein
MRGGTAAVFPAAEAPSCKRTTASSLARPVPLSADQVSPEAKQVPSDQKVSDPQGQSAPTWITSSPLLLTKSTLNFFKWHLAIQPYIP